MNETNNFICSSCRKQKHELKAKKSKLEPSLPLYLCNDCVAKKYEPRWVVIMAGRKYGAEHVKDYLKPKRYIGDEILLSEVVPSL